MRARSRIVKWVLWEYKQRRLRETWYEGCTGAAREDLCPLCQAVRYGVAVENSDAVEDIAGFLSE